jgi:glucose dehydrogenase
MKVRFLPLGLFVAGLLVYQAQAQTDWPNYSHDAGGSRYAPLKQINEKNVTKLKLAWTFDPTAPVTDPPRPGAGGAAGLKPLTLPAGASANTPGGPPRAPRVRQSKTTPLVIGNTMYMSTPYNRVVALNAETGTKIWEYMLPFSPASRGISYWPGEGQDAPEIFIGTSNGRLIAINAKTGKPVPGFGEDGILNVRVGVADKYPNGHYGISSPPAIYKNLVITGCQLQEMPSKGPSGDVRAWDVRTGKLVWTFHTLPRPGELNHDDWQEDQWQDRSGLNVWGIMTVDVRNGIAFLPVGTPTTDFYGADRKGKNLYGSSLVAVDAATGKLKWYFQTSYHDNWDYDVTAAPVMITVKRNGKEIPAVAQTTKQGLMFILDRFTGKPIYPVEDRPVVNDNIPPGDEPSPVQPFPVKPAPLTRNTFAPDELAKLTPEHDKACKDLLSLEGGVLTGGPYSEYGPKLRVIFPGWTGGGNWGGSSYDPKLGYVFVNTKSDGMLNKLVKQADGTYDRVGPDHPPPGVRDSFQVGPWPCQGPPWGEFMAVNVNTGDIVWRVPLGSFPELDALGIPTTGRTNVGGSISTAGGLTFIAASEDGKFRAFDSKTGKILWVTDLNSTGAAVPVSYRGKNGKQYVAIMSNGQGGKNPAPSTMYVYALP